MTSLDPPLEIQMNKRTHAIGMVVDQSLDENLWREIRSSMMLDPTVRNIEIA